MITLEKQTPVVSNFIVDMMILTPVKDIISKLETGNFRDCDVKWLNDRLNHFVKLSLETLGRENVIVGEITGSMNEYNNVKFIKYFKTILKYFVTYV